MALAHPDITEPDEPLADVTGAVMAALAERPLEGWRTSALVRRLPHVPILAVIRTIAEGHRSGVLERLAPATYRIATVPPLAVAARNELLMWGEP